MGRRKGHLFHPSEGSGRGTLLGHGPIFSDFNVAKDPEATTAVLKMNLPITLIPYDAARFVEIGASDLDRLTATGGAAAWVARRSREWLGYWNDDIGRSGFYPFDLLAAAYVTQADRFDCAHTHVWAAPGGDLFPPFYSPVSVIVGRAHEAPDEPLTSGKAIYCTRVHRDMHRILLDRLTAAASSFYRWNSTMEIQSSAQVRSELSPMAAKDAVRNSMNTLTLAGRYSRLG